jgi:threonyl-tRNA synthetase
MISNVLPLDALRRSAASLLAYTVLDLFPDVLIGESRATDLGFFCDCIFTQKVTEDFLPLIDERMRLICNEEHSVRSLEMMRENAAELFKHKKQYIKAELTLLQEQNIVEVIQIGEFYDLCPSPHLSVSNSPIAFKLQSLREVDIFLASEPLTVIRIEGTAFPNKQELKIFLKLLEQAKKNDHCKIGLDSKYFTFHPSGCCLWLPKGIALRDRLLDLGRQEVENQVQVVKTSECVSESVLRELAAEDERALPSSQESFHLFPAQFLHCYLYQAAFISGSLPVSFSEVLQQHSPQEEAACNLLEAQTHTLEITQCFCSSDHVQELLTSSLQLIFKTITMFDFEHEICLSNQPKGFKGCAKAWRYSHELLENALKTSGCSYQKSNRNSSHWAYGPRIEVKCIDQLGRKWDGPFVGLDCYHPTKLKLRCQDHNKKENVPFMISASTLGSLERCIALLLERTSGELPFWLAQEHIRILAIADRHYAFAKELQEKFQIQGLKAFIDCRDEKLAVKMYNAQLEKIPYTIVIGDQEVKKQNLISVRALNQRENKQMTLESFVKQCAEDRLFCTKKRKIGS